MGRSVPHNLKSTHQTEFVKIFNSLCGRYGRWEIWQDFITLAAIAISNTVDRSHAAVRGGRNVRARAASDHAR